MKHLFLSLVLFFGSSFFAQEVHDLARTGTADQMEAFLSKDSSSVNRLSDRGMTPFILACYRGNNEVAKVLLEKGADVGYCAAEGSAIYGMIFKNNIEMLDYTLALGYSPNDTCQFQQFGTPLHMAMSLKRYEIVEMLLKYKASKSVPDPKGKSIKELLKYYKDERLTAIFNAHEND
ncbi:MAG: ankyrin repeat domain-containing protein [Flavobacteriia bacterium]|nr:ankyrin repeat domain-containing protein [Flavobacteriia bacterium]